MEECAGTMQWKNSYNGRVHWKSMMTQRVPTKFKVLDPYGVSIMAFWKTLKFTPILSSVSSSCIIPPDPIVSHSINIHFSFHFSGACAQTLACNVMDLIVTQILVCCQLQSQLRYNHGLHLHNQAENQSGLTKS